MNTRRERLRKLFGREAVLKAELRAIEEEIDKLLPDGECSPIGIKRPQHLVNLTDRILETLRELTSEDTTLSPAEIAQKMGATVRIDSVRSTLIRLWQEKRIDRPSLGKYRKLRAESAVSG